MFSVAGGYGAGGDQIRDVGSGLTLGIVTDTFVVRTVLVPCTCVLLGRWNWWPSRLRAGSPGAAPAGPAAVAVGLAGPDGDGSDPEVSRSVAPDGKHSLD